MSIKETFVKERNRYLQRLLEARAKACADYPGTAFELPISVHTESIPYPYRYLRLDLLSPMPDGTNKACEVKLDADPAFKSLRYAYRTFEVEVNPFTWNAVQILINNPIADRVKLDDWVTQCLDVSGEHADKDSGLSLAAHHFTQITKLGDWWCMVVDLGSAPPRRLWGLVELMVGLGVTRIVIKSAETAN